MLPAIVLCAATGLEARAAVSADGSVGAVARALAAVPVASVRPAALVETQAAHSTAVAMHTLARHPQCVPLCGAESKELTPGRCLCHSPPLDFQENVEGGCVDEAIFEDAAKRGNCDVTFGGTEVECDADGCEEDSCKCPHPAPGKEDLDESGCVAKSAFTHDRRSCYHVTDEDSEAGTRSGKATPGDEDVECVPCKGRDGWCACTPTDDVEEGLVEDGCMALADFRKVTAEGPEACGAQISDEDYIKESEEQYRKIHDEYMVPAVYGWAVAATFLLPLLGGLSVWLHHAGPPRKAVERRYDGEDGPFRYDQFTDEYGAEAEAKWTVSTPGPPEYEAEEPQAAWMPGLGPSPLAGADAGGYDPGAAGGYDPGASTPDPGGAGTGKGYEPGKGDGKGKPSQGGFLGSTSEQKQRKGKGKGKGFKGKGKGKGKAPELRYDSGEGPFPYKDFVALYGPDAPGYWEHAVPA